MNMHKRAKTTRQRQMLSREDFETYLLCKAADVISDNNYKKFLVRSKDNQEEWAIQAMNSVAAVQAENKLITQHIHDLHSHGHLRIWKLCNEVRQCRNAPARHLTMMCNRYHSASCHPRIQFLRGICVASPGCDPTSVSKYSVHRNPKVPWRCTKISNTSCRCSGLLSDWTISSK